MFNFKINFSHKTATIFLLFSIFVLVSIWMQFNFLKHRSMSLDNKILSGEIKGILATKDISTRKDLYLSLIKRVGPMQAQEELFHSGLPFDGETHLLNHIVGDYLYKEFGTKGLAYCKDYFLSSCYHGFVLHTIADGGMKRVAETFDECLQNAPGVYTQCAHGIGHGFLANVGYKNLTQALKKCDSMVDRFSNFPAFNCYDGVFMENIWAVHNGKPSEDRWVREDDLLYPCDESRIDHKYLNACFANQPALIAMLTKGDLKKIGYICLSVDELFRETCFDGLARQIHPMVNGSVDGTFELCSLMPSPYWNNFCISRNAGSAYGVGDRDMPFKLCNIIDEDGKSMCYERLFSMMGVYMKSLEENTKLCSKISTAVWREDCKKRFIY